MTAEHRPTGPATGPVSETIAALKRLPDLRAAIDAAGNNNAFRMLARDVENITAYCGRQAPELRNTWYAHEIWKLFQAAELRPDSELTGQFEFDETEVDVDGVLAQIEEARWEAEARQRGRFTPLWD